MKRFIFLFLLAFGFSPLADVFGQTPAATQPMQPAVVEDDDVVKVTTSLVQIDVVATDKNGKQITDLKAADFEIFENDEKQPITNFAFVPGGETALANGTANVSGLNSAVYAAPTTAQVKRTLAIVVDDLRLSADSVNYTKKALTKFIAEQSQPGDLIAIIKTSGSVAVLQQFTNDKRRLLEAVADLKYQPTTSVGLTPFAPINVSFAQQVQALSSDMLSAQSQTIAGRKNDIEKLNDILRREAFAAGTLTVLNVTIKAMENLPGRKAILFATEGTGISNIEADALRASGFFNQNFPSLTSLPVSATNSRLRDYLRIVAEAANRSAISIYPLDPRGSLPINLSATDATNRGMFSQTTRDDIEAEKGANTRELVSTQQDLKFLAEETGGKAFINNNDLGKGLRDTLDSQNSYYLVAYQPNADTFDADKRRFNKLTVKVKRPNVRLIYRNGFFNIAENNAQQAAQAPEREFMQKLFSPYVYNDVAMKIASVYAGDEKSSIVRTLINVEPTSLQFSDGANGRKTARFDLVAMTFNEKGLPTAQVAQNFEISVSPDSYKKLLEKGILCNLSFAPRESGYHQVKVALRDHASNRIGTAAQRVDVPNLNREPLGLSGILLQNYTAAEWQNVQNGKPAGDPAEIAARAQNDTAQRRFKIGSVLSFSYAAYVAATVKTKPQAQVSLFKDGKELFKGAPEDLNLTQPGTIQRISRNGAITLGTDLVAGKYILQIAVAAEAGKPAQVQWIDFELIG